jgi:hypothetical protein
LTVGPGCSLLFRLAFQGLFSQAISISRGWMALVKIRDNEQWVKEQFGDCQLGNALRTQRLQKVAAQMLRRPEESLPEQNPEWADLKGAYRFFACKDVTFQAICGPHWDLTRQSPPGRYLLISDTTDIDHSSHAATEDLGPLGNGHGRGFQLHSCLVYNSAQQLLVGTAGALIQYRVAKPKNETRMQRLARVRESDVWGALVDQIGAPPPGAQWIHVFDRGGDNFEALCHIQLSGCDCIIRASKLNRQVTNEQGDRLPLGKALETARVLGSYELGLRSRPGMPARTATLQVSVAQVRFAPPQHHSRWVTHCGIQEITLQVVVVEELHPTPGAAPIRWVLLTSLPVTTLADAWQIIEDYEHRWLIEEYHKVLKTGCGVERHALRTGARLEALVGLTSVLGTRLLQLKLVGRNQPEAKATTHVPAAWLQCLKLARPKVKLTDMTVYTFFRTVAKLGGFLGRTGDGEPGWQTIWRGLKQLLTLLEGVRLIEKN